MPGKNWTRRTLTTLLGEKAVTDEVVRQLAPFTQMDIDRMRDVERDSTLEAFKTAVLAARAERGDAPAEITPEDIWAGLRAARAALEAVPQDERSNRAVQLLADCACQPAVPAEI